MIRGLLAALYEPKVPLTCLPVASKRAVVSIEVNCVWLNALYISQRSCTLNGSLTATFLIRDKSQLFTPGPRIMYFAEFPIVPTAGGANTLVSKLRLKVLSPELRLGLPVTTMRAARSGVPVMSLLVTRLYPTPSGAPVTKLVMPDTCHPCSTYLAMPVFRGPPGTSHR